MKKGSAFFMVIMVLVSLTIGGISISWAADKPIVLKYAEHNPKYARTASIMWWIDQVQKRTQGRVKIEYYGASSLVKAFEVPDAIKRGLCDIATFVPVYYPDKIPTWSLADISPVLDAYAVMMSWYDLYTPDSIFQKDLDRFNCRFLYPQTSAGETILVFRDIVTSLEQVKGLKMRAVGQPAKMLKNLGVTPVPMPHPEIYTGLQTGTVSGALAFPSTAWTMGFWEVTKSWLRRVPGQYTIPAMINKDSWNKLPKDIQEIMWETGKQQVRYCASAFDCEEGEVFKKAAEKGVKITSLSPSDSKLWSDQFKLAVEEWKEVCKKRNIGIPAEEILKRFLELQKLYGG